MIVTYADIDGFKNLSGISFAPDEKYNIIVGSTLRERPIFLRQCGYCPDAGAFEALRKKIISA